MTNYVVNSDHKKIKKNFADLLSPRIVQRLTNDQKQDIYKDVLIRLFNIQYTDDLVLDDKLSDVDKLFHFDLMKNTLIKIGKLINEKFKEFNDNDKEKLELVQVLNDTVDRPITLPYLIPNLCECLTSSIGYLLKNNKKVIEFRIDEKLDKKLNEKIEEKLSPQKSKKYKVYSNVTSKEFYESKRISRKVESEDEKKFLEEKIDAIALESNKMHQLNQQYRRNKEEMQDELIDLKERYHKLLHDLEEKNLIIGQKESQFEELELELNAIKVQLETIYKQNQLLDTDKLNLSTNASSLQKRILDLEKENSLSRKECLNLKEIINKREDQVKYLEKEFYDKKSNLDKQQAYIRKLIDDENSHKKQLEHLEMQEKDIKLKHEKLIKEMELKEKAILNASVSLKEEVETLKTKLEDKKAENFKLGLELKESRVKSDNLSRESVEDKQLIEKLREDKSVLLKKIDQNTQELNKFRKLNLESSKLIESKVNEIEQLQSELNSLRSENIEMANKVLTTKTEGTKHLELTKKSFANEIKEKNRNIEELNELINEMKIKIKNLDEEKNVLIKLLNYIENITDLNNQLPASLTNGLNRTEIKQQQISLQFEHYLDMIKELKDTFKYKDLEVNRLKESNRLIEHENDEQKNFMQTLQTKLNSNNSKLKLKDCELVHLKDELAEIKAKKSEDEIEKLNLMKEFECLKDEKSGLELMVIELKKQITNSQLRNVELENELQVNLNKIINLEKLLEEANERNQYLSNEKNDLNENLAEMTNFKDQLEHELETVRKKVKENEQMYQNEKELNLNLNILHQQSIDEKEKLEKHLAQLSNDNKQLEFDLDKIETEFKSYESKSKDLINDRNYLLDLITKYNLILKSHLSLSREIDGSDKNYLDYISNKTNLKLIKPDYLIQVLLELQNELSRSRRQIELLKENQNELKFKIREENNLNNEYRALIEFNEQNLLTKKVDYEKIIKDQRDFKNQLEKTLEENEKLKIEKDYLTEKVLSLDRILEATRDAMNKKFEESYNRKLVKSTKDKNELKGLSNNSLSLDQIDLNQLEDVEMRLVFIHESLIEFIEILMKNITEYKQKVNQLEEINKALNDRLNEMNHLVDKNKTNENNLQAENEKLKKELNLSNRNSNDVHNRIKQLTNQVNDLQNECSTLQDSLESNR